MATLRIVTPAVDVDLEGTDDELATFAVNLQSAFQDHGGTWFAMTGETNTAFWIPATAGIVITFDGQPPEGFRALQLRSDAGE